MFGASGAIGTAIARKIKLEGGHVIGVSRSYNSSAEVDHWIEWSGDAEECNSLMNQLGNFAPYAAICWAQGANLNDSIFSISVDSHRLLYKSNVEYILFSLQAILNNGYLLDGARLCIISSIWQNIARSGKLSYGITKSAVRGLVLGLASDLSERGILVNAVLPSAINSPMTRNNLSKKQIEDLKAQTAYRRLVTLDEVASAVWMLTSSENTGLTGNFITVDLGFSNVKLL